jgi:hypothetical protein
MHKTFAIGIPLALLAGCSSEPMEGAWRSQVRFSSGDLAAAKDLEFLYVFNRGGTMTESSNYDGAPPVPPAYGVWRELGSGRFETVYLFYTSKPPEKLEQITQGWGPAGHGELTEQITLAPDARTFESTITLRLFDSAGHPVSGGGEGTGRGTRIEFAAAPK